MDAGIFVQDVRIHKRNRLRKMMETIIEMIVEI